MKIVISGARGLVGSALCSGLAAEGHGIVRLVRRQDDLGPNEAPWNPAAGKLDPAIVAGADAVINLNGRNIGEGRWNARIKKELYSSRLDATTTIVEAMAVAEPRPALLVNASATGFYGDRGEEVLEESSSAGNGFLSYLCCDWEAAALKARSDRTRVVCMRLGMVVAKGGALARMLPLFKIGLGGPIGSGRQYWPWVAIDDVVGFVQFALTNEQLTGPVNLVSPEECRCKEFTQTLARVLHRPAALPAPAFALRLALGEMAEALLLASLRVRPHALEKAGYTFRMPRLEKAIRITLGRAN